MIRNLTVPKTLASEKSGANYDYQTVVADMITNLNLKLQEFDYDALKTQLMSIEAPAVVNDCSLDPITNMSSTLRDFDYNSLVPPFGRSVEQPKENNNNDDQDEQPTTTEGGDASPNPITSNPILANLNSKLREFDYHSLIQFRGFAPATENSEDEVPTTTPKEKQNNPIANDLVNVIVATGGVEVIVTALKTFPMNETLQGVAVEALSNISVQSVRQ